MTITGHTITEARMRMTPGPAEVAALARRLARQGRETGCPGLVLATYLAEVVFSTARIHAAECRNRRCYTCAGIATALAGVTAHNRLYRDQIAEKENP